MKINSKLLAQSVADLTQEQIDESAVPSYTHWNPVMKAIMWQRIKTVQSLCKNMRCNVCLDFGTGTGVMLPFLSEISDKIIAADVEVRPVSTMVKMLDLKKVEVCKVHGSSMNLADNSVDLIFCLDVLEHFNDLSAISVELHRILKKNGKLVISGPTENMLYKIGRFFAGFSGKAGYHHCNVDDVDKALSTKFSVIETETLFQIAPLFKVIIYKPNN